MIFMTRDLVHMIGLKYINEAPPHKLQKKLYQPLIKINVKHLEHSMFNECFAKIKNYLGGEQHSDVNSS